MGPLAASGYAVVALDQRGFGKTKERDRQGGQTITYEDDISSFRMLNLAADIVALVYTLGYTSVAAVIGHDFGSPVAAHCALIRPDVFRSVVMMSAPFTGPPAWGTPATVANAKPLIQQVDKMLAKLDPPRKHYMMYFSSPQANADLMGAPQGLHRFLRTYYHVKSADWKPNQEVRPLGGFSPAAIASMPYYYIMPRLQTMPECLALNAPSAEEIQNNTWLPDDELAVYTSQFTATGFQGGLNWYRCQTDSRWAKDLQVFAGKQIEVPAMFIGGAQDWGVYQIPGAAEAMRTKACKSMEEEDFVLVDGAGHWVQQEKPEEVVRHLLRFVRKLDVL